MMLDFKLAVAAARRLAAAEDPAARKAAQRDLANQILTLDSTGCLAYRTPASRFCVVEEQLAVDCWVEYIDRGKKKETPCSVN